MKIRLLVALSSLVTLAGCSFHSSEDFFFDSGIPRIETTSDQIAYVRTTWKSGRHTETALFDNQDRLLELFRFGQSNSKTWHRYQGGKNTITITYQHGDSSPLGYVSVDTLRQTYDEDGHITVKSWTSGYFSDDKSSGITAYFKRYLGYTAKGDTIVKRTESSTEFEDKYTIINLNRWEKDKEQRLRRHYTLYVRKEPHSFRDTVSHTSQRYEYDSTGRLFFTWYDIMYPRKYSKSGGTDPIWYRYDDQNRLIEERHYTGNMSGLDKMISPEQLASDLDKENRYRKNYFLADSMLRNNKDYFSINYQYEAFDPAKHLSLKIPTR